MRKHFLLDPNIVFLNHGSFGATPRPVFESYQKWQRQLEREPVQFIQNEQYPHLAHAREVLGQYINAPADTLAYIPNATTGVNIVAKSLDLQAGDEVLTTDHIYGACEKTWKFYCDRAGATYTPVPIPLGLTNEEIVERIWAGVTERTKLIFLSHITSPTAITFPVETICERARANGILTLIDGAHVPGQLNLDLTALNADFYTGNCHKWLCAPKGSAFIYVKPEHQEMIQSPIISWGWDEDQTGTGNQFLERLQLQATVDPASYLAVPDAIAFHEAHDWGTVREHCHSLATEWRTQAEALTDLPTVYHHEGQYAQMAAVQLPDVGDLMAFKNRLYDEYKVQIPCIDWNGTHLIRISVQGYNTKADIDASISALSSMLV